MDNQPGPIQYGLLAPPFTFLTNLLLLYHSNPVTLGLVVSCILVKILYLRAFLLAVLFACVLPQDYLQGLLPHLLQVFSQIPITFSMRSVLHPPPITSPLFLLPLLCFIFSCMCGCMYKTVHYRNFQTYTKVERIWEISGIHHLLSTTFNIWPISFHLCSSSLQIILEQ